MKIPFYIVDVFAENKYAGNQLAIFTNAETITVAEMQRIAREINFAESTFITKLDIENKIAEIKIFTPGHEMQFAGHPIIGTSWVLMNLLFENQPESIRLSVPVGDIPIFQSDDLVWLQSKQPQFLDVFSVADFLTFSNLKTTDFHDTFPIQEVSTGSAFVIVPLKNKKVLEDLILDPVKMNNWLDSHCGTNHRAIYFYCLEEKNIISRMLYIEGNQLKEDSATGSASTCLQAFLLKHYLPEIQIVNHQGEFINRASQIYFQGKLVDNYFDIKIGGKTQFIAKGEWDV